MLQGDESERYEQCGTPLAVAWRKMAVACPPRFTPPSLEVFQHELELGNRGLGHLSASELADRIIGRW